MLQELLEEPAEEPAPVVAAKVEVATPAATKAVEAKPEAIEAAAEPEEAEREEGEPDATAAQAESTTPKDTARTSDSGLFDDLPLGPLVLGAGGLAVVLAGLTVGAMASSTESDYQARVVNTPKQAELAERDRARGKREVLIADVLLGTGAAAIAGAAFWFVIDRRHADRSTRTALTPHLGPDGAGLVLAGTWEPRP